MSVTEIMQNVDNRFVRNVSGKKTFGKYRSNVTLQWEMVTTFEIKPRKKKEKDSAMKLEERNTIMSLRTRPNVVRDYIMHAILQGVCKRFIILGAFVSRVNEPIFRINTNSFFGLFTANFSLSESDEKKTIHVTTSHRHRIPKARCLLSQYKIIINPVRVVSNLVSIFFLELTLDSIIYIDFEVRSLSSVEKTADGLSHRCDHHRNRHY